jgi:hypothetical protein
MATCLALVGCGVKSSESAVRENMACMEEATRLLGTIRDEASAKAARPELLKLGKRMGRAMHTNMSGQLSASKSDTALGREFRAVQQRYADEAKRVLELPAGRDLVLEFYQSML